MTARILFITLIVLLLDGCNTPVNEVSGTTPAALIRTTTLPAATTPAPSEMPLPPPSQPTTAPVEGITSTQVNVRAEPSTASNILGMIPASTKVEIFGKDPGGNWFQINYQEGIDGKGWVTAKYVTTMQGANIPVIVASGTNLNNGNVAIVQQQINVRSGPGTTFNSLGILNAQDVVNLIGKDANGAWLQIEFAAGPEGKGWVNAAFVQAKGVENVPIIAQAGNVIGTGTPTVIPFTPTPTVIPAWNDQDSQNHPVASVVFEPLGTHALIYSGDISTPEGDSEDWLQFTPYRDTVLANLECDDNRLQVNLLENGRLTILSLLCGDEIRILHVKAGAVYSIRLRAPRAADGLQYIHYTIKIEMGQ